jgi:hypothetical protein
LQVAAELSDGSSDEDDGPSPLVFVEEFFQELDSAECGI